MGGGASNSFCCLFMQNVPSLVGSIPVASRLGECSPKHNTKVMNANCKWNKIEFYFANMLLLKDPSHYNLLMFV